MIDFFKIFDEKEFLQYKVFVEVMVKSFGNNICFVVVIYGEKFFIKLNFDDFLNIIYFLSVV